MTAEDTGLDPTELRAWISIVAVMESLPTKIDRQLKDDSDINLFEYTLLAMLSEQPNQTMTMSELAALAFGSLSRLSHAVTRLEKRGWIERSPGAGGRRHNVVSLRSAGADIVTKTAPAHIANVHETVLAPLAPGEAQLLGDLMIKILSRANPELSGRFDELLADVIDRNHADGQPT
jgi:DNA-binding MarR family transcriptional regulator